MATVNHLPADTVFYSHPTESMLGTLISFLHSLLFVRVVADAEVFSYFVAEANAGANAGTSHSSSK